MGHEEEIDHNARYVRVHAVPRGAERALAEYLIEHDIEVGGLPKHGGGTAGSGGFRAALEAAIDEERAREVARAR